jgi:ABC-type transport system substrate-binding protein
MSPIPPGIFGHNPDLPSPYRKPGELDAGLEKARRFMERAGFPNGEGLPKLYYDGTSSAQAKEFSQQFIDCMARIGVQLELRTHSWPEFNDLVHGKRGQVWGVAWLADYPDPENFLQLLYGPNSAPGPNGANYKSDRYDELYRQMVQLPNGPERQAVIDEMVKIVQRDCPWIFGVHRKVFVIQQGWLRNYKYAPIGGNYFRFYRIDTGRKQELLERF